MQVEYVYTNEIISLLSLTTTLLPKCCLYTKQNVHRKKGNSIDID